MQIGVGGACGEDSIVGWANEKGPRFGAGAFFVSVVASVREENGEVEGWGLAFVGADVVGRTLGTGDAALVGA